MLITNRLDLYLYKVYRMCFVLLPSTQKYIKNVVVVCYTYITIIDNFNWWKLQNQIIFQLFGIQYLMRIEQSINLCVEHKLTTLSTILFEFIERLFYTDIMYLYTFTSIILFTDENNKPETSMKVISGT